METILFTALSLGLLEYYFSHNCGGFMTRPASRHRCAKNRRLCAP